MGKLEADSPVTQSESLVSDQTPIRAAARWEWLRQPDGLPDPGPPPDGGWDSWRQVLGGFTVVFLCWGFINSFGLFQTYYESQPNIVASPSNISWIGTFQIWFLMFTGAYSGSASDAGYFRLTSIFGACLFVLGVFMASISHTYYQLLLSHGVCVGLGMGFIFIPTMSTVSTYWSSKRKTLALGCMLCGAAVGGMVLPIMFNHLLPRVGFGWSLRIFGFVAATLFTCSQFLLKKRMRRKEGTRVLEFEALKDSVFLLYVTGSFVNFLGLYFAFFFIASYAREVLHLSFSDSSKLLLVINGSGIPGRLLPMWLADQRQWKGVRPVTVQLPLNLATSILMFAWIAADSKSSLYIFAAIYGFSANAVQSLFPATMADMTQDPRKTGAQLGWGFTIGSFPCLTGVPIGGALVQAAQGQYLYAQIYGGVTLLMGGVIVAGSAWFRMRKDRKMRAEGD